MEKFCYLGNLIKARVDAVQSVITRSRKGSRKGWSKFRDLVPLLVSRGFPIKVDGRLYSAYSALFCSVILYGYENL